MRHNASRQKPDLLKRFNLICPVQPSWQKYFRFLRTQISSLSRHPVPKEGRFAVVTNEGWDAVDAAVPSREMSAGQALGL